MARPIINTLSLCSGVGMLDEGFRLGCEHLGFASRVVAYGERESYAAGVLLARMEDAALEPAPIWCGDFAECDWRSFRGVVDAVIAGFPCQPWSHAGKQLGTDDERWLWPALFRVILDVAPRFVFLENVPGLVSGGGIEHVLSDLSEVGFDAEWCHLTASDVGAPHKRQRVFILAYASGARGQLFGRSDGRQGGTSAEEIRSGGVRRQQRAAVDEQPELRDADVADTARISSGQRPGRQRILNGADTTRGGLGIVRQPPGSDAQPDGSGGIVGDTERNGRRECQPGRGTGERAATGGTSSNLFPPGPTDFDGWGRIVADGSYDFRAPSIKPGLRLLADGLALVVDASRADQLRCAGNGVVALQAGAAFVGLMRRVSHDLHRH